MAMTIGWRLISRHSIRPNFCAVVKSGPTSYCCFWLGLFVGVHTGEISRLIMGKKRRSTETRVYGGAPVNFPYRMFPICVGRDVVGRGSKNISRGIPLLGVDFLNYRRDIPQSGYRIGVYDPRRESPPPSVSRIWPPRVTIA